MERRPYFIFGDLVACLATGALVGAACAALFGPGWNMLLAMFVGMALGMALTLPLTFLVFLALFGAMEVMVPSMLTGMVVGMVVSMEAAMQGVTVLQGIEAGLVVGFLCMVGTYLLNARLTRRAEPWIK